MNNNEIKEQLSTQSCSVNENAPDILDLWAATFDLCRGELEKREIFVECAFCVQNLTISGKSDALILALKMGIDWAVEELPRGGTLICTSTRDEAGRALLTITCGEVDTTFECAESASELINTEESEEGFKELPNTEYWRGRGFSDEAAQVCVETLLHGGTRLVYAFPASRVPLY